MQTLKKTQITLYNLYSTALFTIMPHTPLTFNHHRPCGYFTILFSIKNRSKPACIFDQ